MKATRFNRNMGLGMLAMGIVLLLIVFGMLYVAFQAQSDKAADTAEGDSLILIEHLDQQ